MIQTSIQHDSEYNFDIAIIGMSCRFPGAGNIARYWNNLSSGIESITFFTDEELKKAGVDHDLLKEANYVKAGAVLDDIEYFDAEFFGITPREAELLDPQQRLFLQCAWEALEDAGYKDESNTMRVGVYAGSSLSTYLFNNLYFNSTVRRSTNFYSLQLSNDKDYLSTRVSYKLNLKGPSINVQTACSTSLVAVHLACQSILAGDCDIALAGGASIRVPQIEGYVYEDGDINSPDGHCRAFDVDAKGTVAGSGVGIVILKRLNHAIRDNDRIYAIIKGSAVNNDGNLKAGFTAPSVERQAEVIAEAMAVANVHPDTIAFIEAHGTGTILGDPIEVMALTQAYRALTDKIAYCAIGSVKTNVGHLDTAAGIAGLIKAALALYRKRLPPSLNFHRPNPHLNILTTPFYINTELKDLSLLQQPLRAGVSAFGIGGTNTHLILEEAPSYPKSVNSKSYRIISLSAHKSEVLLQLKENLASHLRSNTDLSLQDVAFTLHKGRKDLPYRYSMVVPDIEIASNILVNPANIETNIKHVEITNRDIVFMFSGQGVQYANMGRELYESEPIYHENINLCAEILRSKMKINLLDVLYPSLGKLQSAQTRLQQTASAQIALFTVEYALSKLWIHWGIKPTTMIGHSIGEYVAACLAGVFSLEDGLTLVANRGSLLQKLPAGAMLAVSLGENELTALLSNGISIAAINGPRQCVVSGNLPLISAFQADLKSRHISTVRLKTNRAFHSEMVAPIIPDFHRCLEQIHLLPPSIPYISNVTGDWIKADEAASSEYWINHLKNPVQFHKGLSSIGLNNHPIFLEVGPGQTLSNIIKNFIFDNKKCFVFSSMPGFGQVNSDYSYTLNALSAMWQIGIGVNWDAFYSKERLSKISLPSYPFEKKRYWINMESETSMTTSIYNMDIPILIEDPLQSSQNEKVNPSLPLMGDFAVNQVLEVILSIIESLLGVSHVNGDQDFFEIGGDSLLAIQLISRVREMFFVQISLDSFFTNPTARHLAFLVKEGKGEIGTAAQLEHLIDEIEQLSDDEAFIQSNPQYPNELKLLSSIEGKKEEFTIQALLPQINGSKAKAMQFSIFFFPGNAEEYAADKYKLVIDCSRFADENEFVAVWTPERHLHQFGGLYPSPSVLSSALAMITQKIQLRAGSVVLPLHHPLQVAEEWSIVDNLSHGRVGISFAPGFHPQDFILAPQNYRDRRTIMYDSINKVQRLWRGEDVIFTDGDGNSSPVKIFPKPIQKELPIWITASANPATFEQAGAMGVHILTALLGLSLPDLKERIDLYRSTREKLGYDPGQGKVTVMLHTFIGEGDDPEIIRETIRQPFQKYLRSHVELVRTQAEQLKLDFNNLTQRDEDELYEYAFRRYFDSDSLIGTPNRCLQMIRDLQSIGVDEIACLIDFGLDYPSVLESLHNLVQLRYSNLGRDC